MKKVRTALKHLFIPHEHNDYKPHFFREASVIGIVIASLLLLSFSAGSSYFLHKTARGATVASSVLVDLTNEDRVARGIEPLARNTLLDTAAERKGEDMVAHGYFAHNSPSGITPWHWFNVVGYIFLYAGENLAVNFTSSRDIETAWLDSPSHRANLLDVKFKEIGLAVVRGFYEGNPTIFVVQMFGTPAEPTLVTDIGFGSTESLSKTTTKNTVQAVIAPLPHAVTAATTASLADTYEPLFTTDQVAVVKNTGDVKEMTLQSSSHTEAVRTYSTWYERVMFGGTSYVDVLYKLLLFIVASAFVTMILIESHRQHWKHTVYGLVLLITLLALLYINRSFAMHFYSLL